MEIDPEKYFNDLESRGDGRPDFRSELEELAWTVARFFDEPYLEWKKRMFESKLSVGYIRQVFIKNNDGHYSKKQQAKILMHELS